jgi:hypothetical protein
MTDYTDKRPVRFFYTTGPCNPLDHYILPPADRLVGAQLGRYIRDKLYGCSMPPGLRSWDTPKEVLEEKSPNTVTKPPTAPRHTS